MKTIEIMKALDSLCDLGCEVFYVTGGEPLLREDLFEVLGYAKEKGIKIVLTTSGYDADSFLQQIEDAGVDSIMICINGHKTYHDQIRDRQGSYERCLKTIRSFYDIDIPVVAVSMVIMDGNVMDIPKIIEDVYTYGGNQLRFQPLVTNNIEKNDSQTVENAFMQVVEAREKGFNVEISEAFGYLGNLEPMVRSFKFYCGCGWDTFTIMPNGNVMGCPVIGRNMYIEGNIRKNDLQEIWVTKFERFRRDLFWHLPSVCKACKHVQTCQGGCWLYRAYGMDPCFLNQAEKLAARINETK
jgi:radical SAM protein with 4Fe4S-binding SPASM domain